MSEFKPPLAITIHGIRTHAHWQKVTGDILNDHNIKHRSYDFGRYGLPRFLLSSSREKQVDNFYDFYNLIVKDKSLTLEPDDYLKRPSIIAHSFGSYIVGYCMLKYRDVKFDKIILCGSILPVGFDWFTLFSRDQVNFVRNEYGLKDSWSRIVGRAVRGTGESGCNGFRFLSTIFSEERFDYFHHSDYFHPSHIENYWIPFLKRQPLSLTIKHGSQIARREEFATIIDTTEQIDQFSYTGLPHYEEVALPSGLPSWIDVNPDIYTFLYDRRNDMAKGYINAMPIDDDVFDQIKKGLIKDNEITDEYIVPFAPNQTLKVYMMSIAIAPDVRQMNQGLYQEPFERLINGFIGKLIYYATYQRTKVDELIAIGWTPQGRKLCKLFGMREINKDEFRNPIFWVDLNSKHILEKQKIFPAIRKLVEVYQTCV
jgi:pimeloyl-ACP methyl ester carboxylesterase